MPSNASLTCANQQGVVLLLCLVFLTAMMLVGLSASADTVLQNKLAANQRASEHARQAAHAALSWAEAWLLALDLPSPADCGDVCSPGYLQATGNLPAHPEYEPLSWWGDNAFETGSDPATSDTTLSPSHFDNGQSLWLIEPVHQAPATEDGLTGPRVWYRVLSRGHGGPESVVSVIESVLIRTWPTDEQTSETGIGASAWCAANSGICGRVSWRELR